MSTTVELDAAAIAALRTQLEAQGFSFKPLDYGHFQARGEGVAVNAYKSGKVVIQGKGEAAFLEAHGFLQPAAVIDERVVGSDESGKGDYFGPLVVAAVTAGPEEAVALRDAGVRDSKKMSDGAILRAAVVVRRICPHDVQTLTPVEYNAAHEREGNVALFLSRMHAQAIAGAIDERCTRAVIDQFTFAERLENALRDAGVEVDVEIRPRAEDNIAVAAASVLSRAEFLIGLKDLGSEHGLELPKGAGANVDRMAREIFRAGGIEALAAIAKTHFKTTRKVTERLF